MCFVGECFLSLCMSPDRTVSFHVILFVIFVLVFCVFYKFIMNTYHAVHWSSDPSYSSDEDDERYNHAALWSDDPLLQTTNTVTIIQIHIISIQVQTCSKYIFLTLCFVYVLMIK